MIIPQLPSHHFKTYEIVAPLPTHFRKATCAEVNCKAYVNGWVTRVPVGSQAEQYIRSGASGRRFTETTTIDSAEREFVFEPGQQCFASDTHRVSLQREPLYVARGGDARDNPTGERRVHQKPEHWVEDFAEHQNRVRKSREG